MQRFGPRFGGERGRFALDGRTGVRCYFPLSGSRSGCHLWTFGGLELGPNQDRLAIPTENRLAVSVTGEVIDIAYYFDDGASGPDRALSELALQPSTSGRSC
jgi:hypothetical protein